MMRAGQLDRMITLQRKTETYSPSGAPIVAWSDIAYRRHAKYRVVRGEERFSAAQYVAKEQIEFTIRYSEQVADLSPLDRIVYPARQDANPPENTIFDIMAVHELGRREGLRIMAARRADV
jgi:SPP1 family predicted phage head-tail adaptor